MNHKYTKICGKAEMLDELKDQMNEFNSILVKMKDKGRNEVTKIQTIRDHLMILENYCERYSPVVILKTVRRLVRGMLSD